MAQAVIGGQLRAGVHPASIWVVEPTQEQRQRLTAEWGVQTLSQADARLQQVDAVVWAVKPQQFVEACRPCAPFIQGALQISVMAGISIATIARHTNATQMIRAMPNTPALIGQGMTGVFANAAVTPEQRRMVDSLLRPTGQLLWVEKEIYLDAVTALSGSGPAYVFYFLEAMIQVGVDMGLDADQAKQLALATFHGATSLAASSTESPAVLRERVTSKGGTTHAAISHLDSANVKIHFMNAILAAKARAEEMGRDFI